MNDSLFTLAQWQELEHQALIFKYLKAGIPVPPDLLVPIKRSFQLMSPSLFHQPTSCTVPIFILLFGLLQFVILGSKIL